MPAEVAGSDRFWGYVLDHGEDDCGTGWTVDWIAVAQARRLLVLLELHHDPESRFDLVWSLRQRCESRD